MFLFCTSNGLLFTRRHRLSVTNRTALYVFMRVWLHGQVGKLNNEYLPS